MVLDIALVRIRIDTQSYLVCLDGIILTQIMTVCRGCVTSWRRESVDKLLPALLKKKLLKRILYSETTFHDMIKPQL